MTVRRFEQKKCIFLTEPTGSPVWAVLPDSQRMTFFLFKSELENSVCKKDAKELYRKIRLPPNFLPTNLPNYGIIVKWIDMTPRQ